MMGISPAKAPNREEIRQDLADHPMPRALDLRMHALQDL